ncbi:copper resistance protein CopC [Modestobacter sp. SSW1-42]|uniref:copper resistance CopC family protein n=1 Tax=Modestobacter sp. SSW1-42 TaxID=596372 RepID=UPI003987075D
MTTPRALPPRRRTPAGPRRWQSLLVVVLAAAFVGAGTFPAQAHDGLVGTVPLNTELLTTAPATVELDFTAEQLPLGTEVLVTGPDGAPVSTGPAEIRGTTVVQALAASLPAGEYGVEWRSTSSDGHALTGSFVFTVAAADPAAAAPTTPAARADPGTAIAGDPQPASADRPADGGLPTGWLVAAVLALAGIGALVAVRLRRRA